jgi:uncharacterized iron-regulated membrane protein
MSDPTQDQGALHRWLWRWHGYAGLFVIPFILFMSLTGIPYVWEHELEDWLYPEYRALSPGSARVSYAQQLATARAACPEKPLGFVKVDGDPRHATHFWFGEWSAPTSVLVNPYDGSVITKMSEWRRLSSAAIILHGLAFMEPYGSWLLELLACWGIVLCLTGVYLWWPRGRKWSVWGVFLPRLRGDDRTRWRDLHAVGGFYFSAVLALYLATGLPWTAFWGGTLLTGIQERTGQAYPHCMTGDSGLSCTPPHVGAQMLPLDAFVEFGLSQQLPGHLEIELPDTPGGSVHVRNRSNATLREAHFQLDPYTARPISGADWDTLPLSQKAVALGIDMHEGTLLGRANQIISTLLAGLFVLLSGAGAMMWWKRRPRNQLDWPKIVPRIRLPRAVAVATVILGVLMPLFGLTVLVVMALDRIRQPTI